LRSRVILQTGNPKVEDRELLHRKTG